MDHSESATLPPLAQISEDCYGASLALWRESERLLMGSDDSIYPRVRFNMLRTKPTHFFSQSIWQKIVEKKWVLVWVSSDPHNFVDTEFKSSVYDNGP
jgi:hypothetical protein